MKKKSETLAALSNDYYKKKWLFSELLMTKKKLLSKLLRKTQIVNPFISNLYVVSS